MNDQESTNTQEDIDINPAEIEKPSGSIEEEYQNKIEELKKENQKVKDQLLRLAAEFDNFRKRSDREYSQVITNANSELISELLPVLDDLDRVLGSADTSMDAAALLGAVSLVHKNFAKILADQGLRPMDSVGKPFDPEKHDALLHMDVEGQDGNMVVEEHKKGYEFKNRVIRHAQVIVSK